MRKWDHYEFKIAGHYLSMLINSDESGMTYTERRELNAWIVRAMVTAMDAGWTIGHWDCDNEEADDWGICAVSGLFAMRQTVRLMVYKDA